MRRMIVLLLAASLALAGCDPGRLPKRQRRTWDATFALYYSSNKEWADKSFICTAVAYERVPGGYHLLTAGHCVDPKGFPSADAVFGVDEEIREKPQIQPVTVVSFVHTSGLDYGILELKSQKQYPIEPLAVSQPRPGQPVYMVHFSQGLGKQIVVGRVSSDPMNAGAYDGECTKCAGEFLIAAFAGSGASGAWAISLDSGKPLGILRGGGIESGYSFKPIGKIVADIKNPAPRTVPTVPESK